MSIMVRVQSLTSDVHVTGTLEIITTSLARIKSPALNQSFASFAGEKYRRCQMGTAGNSLRMNSMHMRMSWPWRESLRPEGETTLNQIPRACEL